MSGASSRVSFHDPDGSVFLSSHAVFRALSAAAGARVEAFLESPIGKDFATEGLLPRTSRIAASDVPSSALAQGGAQSSWFLHERLPFLNYPHEWLPEQLIDAGRSMLGMASRLRAAGWDLKDGNARNVVFRGTRPVFVDFGSLVPRRDSAPIWRPSGQLQRHIFLPILMHLKRGLSPAAALLARPDGITHEEAFNGLRGSCVSDANVFWLCTLPTLLARLAGASISQRTFTPEVSRAAADATVRSLLKRLESMSRKVQPSASHWARYEGTRDHYTSDQLALKRTVVEGMLRHAGPGRVLDIGTNGGEYANLAATLGAEVVSIDNDIAALTVARQRARAAGLDMLHLLVDFAAPTPALGWNGAECLSFDARCNGAFDTVMALAVMHHVLISGGIPLGELIAKLRAYTRGQLVIEYVDPADVKFAELARARDLETGGTNRQTFEAAVEAHFKIEERVEVIAGHRALYRCSRREP
jgi:SAM-dependent methyltransferase